MARRDFFTLKASLALGAALALAHIPSAHATGIDGYIAPIFSGAIPIYDDEYGYLEPKIEAEPRFGVRFESGRFSENISLDARIGFFSGYEDYGLMLRVFRPVGDGPVTFVAGLGFGASYSPGFSAVGSPTTEGFLDLVLNPYARVVFDLDPNLGLLIEGGWTFGLSRTFNDGFQDGRVKNRGEVAAGLVVAFEELGEYGTLDDAPENSDTARYKSFTFGFIGGFTGTRMYGGTPSDGSSGGYLAGLGIDFGGPVWGGTIDGLFSQRTLSAGGLKVRSNMVEVPALVRYRIGAPSFLYLTGGGFFRIALTDGAKPDYGLLTGIGFGIPSQFALFTIEGRFGFGLANLNSDSVLEDTKATRSQTFDLAVGLMF